MDRLLDSTNDWAVYLATILLIIGGEEIGAAFARRGRQRPPGDADRLLSSLATPSIGLLALMIGFTFAMALSRFDARRAAVLNEANAIGTAALRGQMLPEPYRSIVAPLFRQYAAIRIADETSDLKSPTTRDAIQRSLVIQNTLWRTGMDAAAANPRIVPGGLFLQALNTMIDVHEERLTAARSHVPSVVFFTLEGIAIVAFAFEGYGLQLASVRSRVAMWIMAAMIGSVIMLVFDLDRPQSGFITVDQRPLLDLVDETR
jgi:hypothetical protein